MAAFTPLRDLMLDLCIMLLLKGSPRVDALIEFRRLLRSKDRKIATGGISSSVGFFLKNIYMDKYKGCPNRLRYITTHTIRTWKGRACPIFSDSFQNLHHLARSVASPCRASLARRASASRPKYP